MDRVLAGAIGICVIILAVGAHEASNWWLPVPFVTFGALCSWYGYLKGQGDD